MYTKKASKFVFEGVIKSFANDTYVIADNDESFASWLHQQANLLEGKRVKIIIQDIDLSLPVSLHKIHYTT
jgi:hypothetical protein